MSRYFDATNTGANIQTLSIADSATARQVGAITFAAWVKFQGRPSGFTVGSILSKHPNDATTIEIAFTIHNANFTGTPYSLDIDLPCTSGFTGIVTNEGVTPNVWTHVAFTWNATINAGLILAYINGTQATNQQANANTNPARSDISGHPMIIGNNSFGYKFDGSIAEVRKWDTALSGAEVMTAMNGGTPQSASQKIHLHLCGISSVEPDASGNGNHAQLSVNPPRYDGHPAVYACPSAPPRVRLVGGGRAVNVTGGGR